MTSTEARDLQSLLEAAADKRDPELDGFSAGANKTVSDPIGLFRHLEATKRFHRDTGFGRILHPGSVSFRENSPTDSLHIVVNGNHIAAHVDRVSPLGTRQGSWRYSLHRAAVHNIAGAAHDLALLLRGRKGDHRCELDCEWTWSPDTSAAEAHDLLDPKTTAWSVQLEAQVNGTLDDARLEAALAMTFGRQAPTHRPLEVVDCPDDGALDAVRGELQRLPMDVTEWPPLRIRLAHHPDGDVVMLNVNHAAADGPAALQVLEAIADAYTGTPHTDPQPDFLAVHDLPVRPASAPVSPAMARCRALVERLRDRLANPARLAPLDPQGEEGYGFHFVSLSADDTRQVVDPDHPGTSRNSLLAALHLAIGDWNLKNGTPGRHIGVLVPVNLRPPGWRHDVLGNFSVTARVSTSRRHRSGPAAALKAVTAQTTRNKRTRTGIALLAALERSGLLPLWVKQSLVVLQPLTQNREVDTAMLANLGWVNEPVSFGPEAGETRALWYSTPARAPRCVCIGAVTIGGRLNLVVRYPHQLFSPDAARQFMATYVDHIRSVAGSLA